MAVEFKTAGPVSITTGTELSVSVPAVAVGDYGVLWLYQAYSETPPAVTGWSLAYSELDGAGGIAQLWYRVFTAAAGASTIPVPVAANGSISKVVTWTGADPSAPTVATRIDSAIDTAISPPLTISTPTGVTLFTFMYQARTAGAVSTNGTITATVTPRAWEDLLGAYTLSTMTADVTSAAGGDVRRGISGGLANTWNWGVTIPVAAPVVPPEGGFSTGYTFGPAVAAGKVGAGGAFTGAYAFGPASAGGSSPTPPPTLADLDPIYAGAAVNQALASDGTATITAGTLPSGLSLSSSGVLTGVTGFSWTPYDFTVTASGVGGNTSKRYQGTILVPGETGRTTGTTGTTPWTRIAATAGGDRVLIYVPTGADPTVVVSMMHGAGPDETWPDDEPAPSRDFALNQGWAVMGANAGGVSYASDTALDAWDAAHAWAGGLWPITDVILYAGSMGSQLALIYAAQGRHPGIRGLALVDSLMNLQWYWDNAPTEWRQAIKDAYGFTNDADFATATAGTDPMTLPTSTWDGMNMWVSWSPNDGTILPSQNTTPFLPRASGADVEVYQGSGEHSAPANFAPAVVNPWMLTLWSAAGGFATAYGYGPAASSGASDRSGSFGASYAFGPSSAAGAADPAGAFDAAYGFGPASATGVGGAAGGFDASYGFGPAEATGAGGAAGGFAAAYGFGPAESAGTADSAGDFSGGYGYGPAIAGGESRRAGDFGASYTFGPATGGGTAPQGGGGFAAAYRFGPARAAGPVDPERCFLPLDLIPLGAGLTLVPVGAGLDVLEDACEP